jgi:hypothetical protein
LKPSDNDRNITDMNASPSNANQIHKTGKGLAVKVNKVIFFVNLYQLAITKFKRIYVQL